jgi:2-polyprenyl-3-methyl-5-hydroxy-6-metoxy-1,4-benzoquinol methylase
MEPEYHGDANSADGRGALSYRSYGTDLDAKLQQLGFNVEYTREDHPESGRMNTELFYCINGDRPSGLDEPVNLTESERMLDQRFGHMRTVENRHFYRALLRHFSSVTDDPCIEMYFTFALTSNDRGRRAAQLLTRDGDVKGKRFLDVGCAYGGFLVAMGELGARPVGIDLMERLLLLAQENFRDHLVDYPLIHGDITNPEDVAKLEGPFDLISCNDVIEHVADPETAVRHVTALLAEDGRAFFEIPNKDAVTAVLKDGHYQMFGLTQMDREGAHAYFAEKRPGQHYGVEHMLSLGEYSEMFRKQGLSMELLPETFDYVNAAEVTDSLERLNKDLPELLSEVPSVVRDDVERAVRGYLASAREAMNDVSIGSEEFLLRFGTEFWKVVVSRPGVGSGVG